jgi:hypothetical protein
MVRPPGALLVAFFWLIFLCALCVLCGEKVLAGD